MDDLITKAQTRYIKAHSAIVNAFDPTPEQWLEYDEAVKEYKEAQRQERYIQAAEYIERTISASDVGGRMVMAAFLKDAIDHQE